MSVIQFKEYGIKKHNYVVFYIDDVVEVEENVVMNEEEISYVPTSA
jgi:hypothetical protein